MSSRYGGKATAEQRRFGAATTTRRQPAPPSPTTSWWLATQTREAFQRQVAIERDRMAASPFGGGARTHNLGQG